MLKRRDYHLQSTSPCISAGDGEGAPIDDPELSGEYIKLLYFDEEEDCWEEVENQFYDPVNHRILAYGDLFCLYAIFLIKDAEPPEILNLSDSPDPFSPNGDGFNDEIEISYTLSDNLAPQLTVTLEILDENGELIATLLDDAAQPPGENTVKWDGTINEQGTVAPDGIYTYKVKAADYFGNRTEASGSLTLDTAPPAIEILSAPSGWINTNGVIAFKVDDADPNVQLSVSPAPDSLIGPDSGGKYVATYTQEMAITWITITAADSNQNTSHDSSISFGIDKTPPETTASVSETTNPVGWINILPVTVSFSATDNLSGVAWTTPNAILTEDGIHEIEYHSVDNAGNVEETKVVTVKVDTTPPDVEINASPDTLWPPNHKPMDVMISGSAGDSLSGIDSISFTVVDEYGECEPGISNLGDVIQLIAWRNGSDKDGRIYTIQVTATDIAGNSNSAQTQVIVPHDRRGKTK